jgi:chromosome segregation ATPase
MEQFWKLRKGIVEVTERVKERYHEEMARYERQTEKRLEQGFKEQLERLAEQVDFKEQQVLRRNRDIDELAEEKAEVVRLLKLTKTALKDSEDHLLRCKTQIDKLKKEGELIYNSMLYFYYSCKLF